MAFSPAAAVIEIVLAFGVIGLGVFGYKKFSKKAKQNHN